jgi:hypothetical protein
MIKGFIASFFLLPIFLTAQKPIELKSKFFGSYTGIISSFQLDSGRELADVDSTEIKVEITESNVLITIGKNQLNSTYKVLLEAKKYFLLDCQVENQFAGERIVVYKKGKKISRDGLFPQPNAFLYRQKS